MKPILFILLLSITPLTADEKPVIRFSPEFTEIELGSRATVEVWIDSVQALKGYSVQFSYDTDKVGIRGVSEGTMFTSPTFFASFVDSVEGSIKVESALLGGGRKVDGSGMLFSVDIYGKSEGTDTLSFFDLNIRDVDLARIDTGSRHGILAIGEPGSVDDRGGAPQTYYVYPNFPNPFNPVTNIRFYLPYTSVVSMTVFNTAGERIKTPLHDALYHPGYHTVSVKMAGFPSGMYFYRIEALSSDGKHHFRKTGSMVLLR